MEIPKAVRDRWTLPENEPLRQAVVVFRGNSKKEWLLQVFQKVQLLIINGESTDIIDGSFYLTTKRLAFLPKNTFPHPSFVQATFDKIHSISGSRTDLEIAIRSTESSIVIFQFPTELSLYKCFNLLRSLSEITRLDQDQFKSSISKLASAETFDETPFSSIECEFPKCTNEQKETENRKVKKRSRRKSFSHSRHPTTISYIKSFLDYCNNLHFDIHAKLRILIFITTLSFSLQFIPFLPLTCLGISAILLFNLWKKIERGKKPSRRRSSMTGEIATIEFFLNDWFNWGCPEKSTKLLRLSLFLFASWALLPNQLYILTCFGFYFFLVIMPLKKSHLFTRVIHGFWFCT